MSRWAGMITMSTLAAMIVPIAAPTWRYAARGLNSPASPQARAVASTNSVAASDGVLHDAVEPAAVHRPELARDAGLPPLGRRRGEPAVQPVEVERRADPRDTGDHVGPAEREVEPLLEVGAHSRRLSCRGTSCNRTGSRAAVRDTARHRESRTRS